VSRNETLFPRLFTTHTNTYILIMFNVQMYNVKSCIFVVVKTALYLGPLSTHACFLMGLFVCLLMRGWVGCVCDVCLPVCKVCMCVCVYVCACVGLCVCVCMCVCVCLCVCRSLCACACVRMCMDVRACGREGRCTH